MRSKSGYFLCVVSRKEGFILKFADSIAFLLNRNRNYFYCRSNLIDYLADHAFVFKRIEGTGRINEFSSDF